MDIEFHGTGLMQGVGFNSDDVVPPHYFDWCAPDRRKPHRGCPGWYVAHATTANHTKGDLVLCECPDCNHQPPDPVPGRPITGGHHAD